MMCATQGQIVILRSKWNVPSNFLYERTKSQNLNVSRLVLQFPLPDPVEPVVKSSMKL